MVAISYTFICSSFPFAMCMQYCEMTAPAPPSHPESSRGRIRPIAAPYESAKLIDEEEVSCVFDCTKVL